MQHCPKCAGEVAPDADYCTRCGVRLYWKTPPRTAKQSESSKTVAAVLLILIIVVPSLFWISSVTRLATFTIQVNSDTSWSGSYGGEAGATSVDGLGSQTFRVTGKIASAVFQKRTAYGFLEVSILVNGSVVAHQSTTAEYGVLSVSAHS